MTLRGPIMKTTTAAATMTMTRRTLRTIRVTLSMARSHSSGRGSRSLAHGSLIGLGRSSYRVVDLEHVIHRNRLAAEERRRVFPAGGRVDRGEPENRMSPEDLHAADRSRFVYPRAEKDCAIELLPLGDLRVLGVDVFPSEVLRRREAVHGSIARHDHVVIAPIRDLLGSGEIRVPVRLSQLATLLARSCGALGDLIRAREPRLEEPDDCVATPGAAFEGFGEAGGDQIVDRDQRRARGRHEPGPLGERVHQPQRGVLTVPD